MLAKKHSIIRCLNLELAARNTGWKYARLKFFRLSYYKGQLNLLPYLCCYHQSLTGLSVVVVLLIGLFDPNPVCHLQLTPVSVVLGTSSTVQHRYRCVPVPSTAARLSCRCDDELLCFTLGFVVIEELFK